MDNLDRLNRQQALLADSTKEIRKIVDSLVDEMSFVQKDAFLTGTSRLDGEPIPGEGVLTGTATVDGNEIVVVAQNAKALGGSFGAASARKILNALSLAAKGNLPLLAILDSTGARVGEGVAMLEGYGAVLKGIADLSRQVVTVAYIRGQAAGVTRMFASLCTYQLSLKDAVASVNAPAVAEAKFSLAKDALTGIGNAIGGSIDFVVKDDRHAGNLLVALLGHAYGQRESEDDPNREAPALSLDSSAEDWISAIVDDEYYEEYQAKCAPSIKCVMGSVNGSPVALAVCDAKVSKTLDAAALSKLARFVVINGASGIPFVSVVNCEGLEDKDQNALSLAVADYVWQISSGDFPKIAVVLNAYGSAYATLCSKGIGFDYTVGVAGGKVGAMAPSSAIHLVYRDLLAQKGNTPEVRAQLENLYAEQNCDILTAARDGYLDEVIDPATVRPYVANALLVC